jgi:iron-sulfur cluster assembly protein
LVRLSLQPGGCATWIYAMKFEKQSQPSDALFEYGHFKVAVDPEILPHVTGMTIDYSEDLMGGSFRFVNPHAKQTCGCGHSFSVEPLPEAMATESQRRQPSPEDCAPPHITSPNPGGIN